MMVHCVFNTFGMDTHHCTYVHCLLL